MALPPLDAHGLALLDGRRDAEVLVNALLRVAEANLIRIELDDGRLLTDQAVLRDAFDQYVAALPERLQDMKLARLG